MRDLEATTIHAQWRSARAFSAQALSRGGKADIRKVLQVVAFREGEGGGAAAQRRKTDDVMRSVPKFGYLY